MTTSILPPRNAGRRRTEWLALAIAAVCLATAMCGLLWADRRGVESREADRLQVQARVVGDNLVRQLEGANAALVGVRDEVQALRPEADPARLANRLRLLTNAMPGVRTMLVLDARGVVVATSRDELIGRDLHDRPFFDAPSRAHDPAVLHVTQPFRSTIGGLVVNLARVWLRDDGSLGGVVTATLDPDYFDVVLRSVLYAPDMRAVLVHGDGHLFLNLPADPSTLGLDVSAPGTTFAAHRDSGATASLLAGRLVTSDRLRLMALRTVSGPDLRMDRPIVVGVSRDVASLLRPWQVRAFEYAVFFSVVTLAACVALRTLQRRRLAFERLAAEAAQERLQGARQLRLITDNLPALVSYLDREQRFRFANQAYRDWLDVEPASLIGKSLRELYGEASWQRFGHYIEAGLAGERVVYEREMPTPRGTRYVQVTLVPQRDERGQVPGLYVLIQDLTERRAAELRSARSEERLSLALEGSGLALFDWDVRADRIYQSARVPMLRGAPAVESVIDREQLQADVHADDRDALQSALEAVVKGDAVEYHAEYRVRQGDGQWMWMQGRGRVVEHDATGRPLRLAGTYADITSRKATEARLRQLAELDTLTGLPNRALFNDRLQQALLRTGRGSRPMALLFIDVDHFKQVNDTLGHEAGDRLLKAFAERLQNTVRKSDTVARLGGDEFTVILEKIRDAADARALAAKLVDVARTPVDVGGRVVQVSASIGLALSHPGDEDGAALLRRADAALYEAKRRGRDAFCLDETPLSDWGASTS